MDAGIPTQERNSAGLAIGFRSWVFSVVSALKKRRVVHNLICYRNDQPTRLHLSCLMTEISFQI